MNTRELIHAIACRTGQSLGDVKKMLNGFKDVVGDTLAKKEKVRIYRFGTFSVKEYKERMGVNPQTGQPMRIKKKNKVRFKAGAGLSDKVN